MGVGARYNEFIDRTARQQNRVEQEMTFFLNNIGYIIMGFLALAVMGSGSQDSDKSEYEAFDESAWANSPENPNSPNYTGI